MPPNAGNDVKPFILLTHTHTHTHTHTSSCIHPVLWQRVCDWFDIVNSETYTHEFPGTVTETFLT